jgi:hypothetical protein
MASDFSMATLVTRINREMSTGFSGKIISDVYTLPNCQANVRIKLFFRITRNTPFYLLYTLSQEATRRCAPLK